MSYYDRSRHASSFLCYHFTIIVLGEGFVHVHSLLSVALVVYLFEGS